MEIENLSLEDIEKILPQLQKQLEESKKLPIDEIVSSKFESEWELVECCLKEQHEKDLEETHQRLYLFTVLENVLQSFIGEELTKNFMDVAKNCIHEKSFRGTQKFYSDTEDSIQRNIARLSFLIIQMNLNLTKSSKVKAAINECVKVSDEVQSVFDTYKQFELV